MIVLAGKYRLEVCNGFFERRAREQPTLVSGELLADGVDYHRCPARARQWDSCLLPNFARTAGGDDPRPRRAQRLRNRPEGLALSLRGMGSGAQPPLHTHLPRLAAYEFLPIVAGVSWAVRRGKRKRVFEEALVLFGLAFGFRDNLADAPIVEGL